MFYTFKDTAYLFVYKIINLVTCVHSSALHGKRNQMAYPVCGAKWVSNESFSPLTSWSSIVISVPSVLSVFHFSRKVSPARYKHSLAEGTITTNTALLYNLLLPVWIQNKPCPIITLILDLHSTNISQLHVEFFFSQSIYTNNTSCNTIYA